MPAGRETVMLKDVVVHVRLSSKQPAASPPMCQKCETDLELHQPNQECPDEMLGICPQCGEWHFVRSSEAEGSVVVALLPLHDLERETNPRPRNRVGEMKPRGAAEYRAGL